MFAPVKLAQTVLDQVKEFKEYLPVIHILCNPGLRQRHWDKVEMREGRRKTNTDVIILFFV